jgi:hypothetical protein
MSSLGYACDSKLPVIAQQLCKKDNTEKSIKKNCCKTNSCEVEKYSKKCDGKCACECSTSNPSLNLLLPVSLNYHIPFKIAEQKQFALNQANYSSGFLSVWLPPKIIAQL